MQSISQTGKFCKMLHLAPEDAVKIAYILAIEIRLIYSTNDYIIII